MLLATGTGDLATPDASVTAVAVALPLKVALAPDPGAVKVTVTPDTGSEDASTTLACRAAPNAVEIAVVCGVPPTAVTETGIKALLVSEKEALNPDAEAVTV